MNRSDAENLKAKLEEHLPEGMAIRLVGTPETEARKKIEATHLTIHTLKNLGHDLMDPPSELLEGVRPKLEGVEVPVILRVMRALGEDMVAAADHAHKMLNEAIEESQNG